MFFYVGELGGFVDVFESFWEVFWDVSVFFVAFLSEPVDIVAVHLCEPCVFFEFLEFYWVGPEEFKEFSESAVVCLEFFGVFFVCRYGFEGFEHGLSVVLVFGDVLEEYCGFVDELCEFFS